MFIAPDISDIKKMPPNRHQILHMYIYIYIYMISLIIQSYYITNMVRIVFTILVITS